jgi:glutamate-ammonia-ligase adenylyltransferase
MSATYGVPILAHSSSSKDTTSELNPCAYVLLGLGKLGGREIGYHSDLDLVLVYEGDGFTRVDPPTQGRQSIDSFQFFSELAQRIVRTLSWMGPLGRLYSVDLRLRPTGSSGSLVAPLSRFQEYYRHDAQTWEMMAITRARVVHGQPTFGWKVLRSIHNALASYPVTSVTIDDILAMRRRLEESRSPFDLKRGAGGLMDIEFIVQLMQLKHSVRHPAILESNVWKALARIAETGLWSPHRVAIFREGYSFLRKVESRIRIVQNLARNDLPSDPSDLAKLALRFGGYAGENPGMQLQHDVVSRMQIIRKEFQAALNDERERR